MQLRKRRQTRAITDIATGYPEDSPSSPFEKLVARLNRQAFPEASYSRVDDILVYSLFATKRRDTWSRSLDPTPVNSTREVTREEGVAIRHICKEHITTSSPTPDECHQASAVLVQQFPQFFSQVTMPIVEQYVPSASRVTHAHHHPACYCGIHYYILRSAPSS
jgi:hypothetical protein